LLFREVGFRVLQDKCDLINRSGLLN
jgi:hypothetical protein